MNTRSTQTHYGGVARGLHWASVGLILALLPLGILMTRMNDGDNTTMYRIHVGIGLLVAVLTVVRVIWRVVEPSPTPPTMPSWRRPLYLANHYGLYVLLFGLAATGIAVLLSNDMTPFPPDVVASEVESVKAGGAHFVLALVFTGLLIMHVVGVLTYQRTHGDVLSRMGIKLGKG